MVAGSLEGTPPIKRAAHPFGCAAQQNSFSQFSRKKQCLQDLEVRQVDEYGAAIPVDFSDEDWPMARHIHIHSCEQYGTARDTVIRPVKIHFQVGTVKHEGVSFEFPIVRRTSLGFNLHATDVHGLNLDDTSLGLDGRFGRNKRGHEERSQEQGDKSGHGPAMLPETFTESFHSDKKLGGRWPARAAGSSSVLHGHWSMIYPRLAMPHPALDGTTSPAHFQSNSMEKDI